MFGKLAHFMYRRRWYVVGFWLAVLIVAASQAVQVGKVLGPGDFSLPGSDSQKVSDVLGSKFHQNDLQVSLIAAYNRHETVTDPAFRRAVNGLISRIQADRGLRVQLVQNPLTAHDPQLISKDRHGVLIPVSSGLKEQDLEGQIDHLRSTATTRGFTTYVTGATALNHDYNVASKVDLGKAEEFTVPILLIILLLVFGAFVAALLPLLLAAFSIVLSLALVYLFGHFLDTSVYVTNVVTVLGLGIAIDYSLFIVYRFREEIRISGDREEAVVKTMQTTGRAVFFSGLTVAIGLSSLILTKLSFMESMGLGGMLVPFTALLVAMTLLPAVLGILGPNVNRWRVLPARMLMAPDTGVWHRLATNIMRRPWLWGGSVLVVMLALAFPLTRLQTAPGSLKNGSTTLPSVAGFDFVQAHYTSAPDPAQIVVQHHGGGTVLSGGELAGIRALEQRLRQDPEAARVQGPADFLPTSGQPTPAQIRPLVGRSISSDLRVAVINVIPRHDSGTNANQSMIRRFRQDVLPFEQGALHGDQINVGGASAPYLDFTDALFNKFPVIVAIVLCLTYGFLFFAFRSVFLPLKAVLLNLLSVGASFGLLELVFQQGVGSSLLAFTPESGVASWVPVFLFAFLFGLSMDYEVFLLSRVREHWLETGNNEQSVAFGLEKTGRLITSAALIMVVAFSGFLIGREVQLKEFGFAMAASIFIDASLIRVILVPSIMKIMGDRNWWVPAWLRGFAGRGVSLEGEPVATRHEEPEAVTVS